MRPQNKRGRGRGGHNPNHPGNNPNRPRGPNRQQSFDSNGPGVKIRGNAYQVFERYIALAREAQTSGDRINAENLYQHAEHYYRILNVDGQFAQRAAATPADNEMQMGDGPDGMPQGQPGQGYDQQPQGGYEPQGQPPQGGYEQQGQPPQQGGGYESRPPQGGFEQGELPAFLGGGNPGQGGYDQPRQQGRGNYEGGNRQGRLDRRGRRGGYDRQREGGQPDGNEPQPYSGEGQQGSEPPESGEHRRDPGSEPQPG